MTRKDQVFVVNVVVNDLTRKMVVSSVISQPTGAIAELNAIAKICKYKRLQEGHHFFPMPWRCTTHLGMIWIVSSGSAFFFFTIDNQEVFYPCLFSFNCSSIVLVLLSKRL